MDIILFFNQVTQKQESTVVSVENTEYLQLDVSGSAKDFKIEVLAQVVEGGDYLPLAVIGNSSFKIYNYINNVGFYRVDTSGILSVKLNLIEIDSGSISCEGTKVESSINGTTDHSQLTNLEFENSGHTGFQAELSAEQLANIDIVPVVEEAISRKVEIWQKNTLYKIGDCVIAKLRNTTDGIVETMILKCIKEHTSSNLFASSVDVTCWEIDKVTAYRALQDISGKAIHKTYAKKFEGYGVASASSVTVDDKTNIKVTVIGEYDDETLNTEATVIIPAYTSDLTNDSGFVTEKQLGDFETSVDDKFTEQEQKFTEQELTNIELGQQITDLEILVLEGKNNEQ